MNSITINRVVSHQKHKISYSDIRNNVYSLFCSSRWKLTLILYSIHNIRLKIYKKNFITNSLESAYRMQWHDVNIWKQQRFSKWKHVEKINKIISFSLFSVIIKLVDKSVWLWSAQDNDSGTLISGGVRGGLSPPW